MRNFKEADTFKCPECDRKVLSNTGYCVSCKKKVKSSKKEEMNIIVENYNEFSYLDSGNKVQVGDRVEFTPSGLMMYGNTYKDKVFTVSGDTGEQGFAGFTLREIPFSVGLLDIQKVDENIAVVALRDNVRVGDVILEKDEKIKVIQKRINE